MHAKAPLNRLLFPPHSARLGCDAEGSVLLVATPHKFRCSASYNGRIALAHNGIWALGLMVAFSPSLSEGCEVEEGAARHAPFLLHVYRQGYRSE